MQGKSVIVSMVRKNPKSGEMMNLKGKDALIVKER